MPDTPAQEPQRELLTLMTARIRDANIREPFYVDGALDLVSVCRELSQRSLTQALVRPAPTESANAPPSRRARRLAGCSDRK